MRMPACVASVAGALYGGGMMLRLGPLSREVARTPDVTEAFGAYERQRRERTAKVQEQSRSMSRIYHASGVVAAGRNLTLRLSGPSFALGRLEWIYRWTPDATG